MAQKNKLLMFGTILIVATIGHSKMLEIKNENTIMFMEENEKEVNDDLFVEFVDGKIAETPDKNIIFITSTNDVLYSSQDLDYIENTFSNKVLIPFGGHTGVLWHKDVANLMVDKLEEN